MKKKVLSLFLALVMLLGLLPVGALAADGENDTPFDSTFDKTQIISGCYDNQLNVNDYKPESELPSSLSVVCDKGYEVVANWKSASWDGLDSYIVRVPTSAQSVALSYDGAELVECFWCIDDIESIGDGEFVFSEHTDCYQGVDPEYDNPIIAEESQWADAIDQTFCCVDFCTEISGNYVAFVYLYCSDIPVNVNDYKPESELPSSLSVVCDKGYEVVANWKSASWDGLDSYIVRVPTSAQSVALSYDGAELVECFWCIDDIESIADGEFVFSEHTDCYQGVDPEYDNPIIAEESRWAGAMDQTFCCVDFCTEISGNYAAFVYLYCSDIPVNINDDKPTADKTALAAAIADAESGNYYHTNDRYNGKTTSVNGFYADMQTALTDAISVNDNASAKQAQVDAAAKALSAAIAKLIPTTQVNATALYEELTKKDQTAFGEYNVYGDRTLKLGDLTEQVQQDYMTAYDAAEAFLATLFDADGNATAANTSDVQVTVDEHANALETIRTGAARATDYEFKEFYERKRDEYAAYYNANSPAAYNQADFTAESWAAYESAYNAMTDAIEREKTFVDRGGYQSDVDFYRAFCNSGYNALLSSVNALVSVVPVTIDFAYIDNRGARESVFNEAMHYENSALTLEPGSTNPAGAKKAAGINVVTGNYDEILFINGKYITRAANGSLRGMQLREGDVVRIVRTAPINGKYEFSSGENSTSIETGAAVEYMYRDSLAQISLNAPETVVVGEKAAFTVSVTGITDEAKAKTFSPEGLSLFVSAPDGSQLTKLTLSTADADGNMTYVFSEPGVYTVGVFNRRADELAFTNVLGGTTPGEYYSCWVGDIQTVTVTAAEDEAALLAQYREENLAAAKAYYEQFTVNDFAAGVYDNLTNAYNTLVSNQNAAATLKALMDAYDTDYTAMEKIGAKKVDHAARIAAFREKLNAMPNDPAALDNSYENMVDDLQRAYNNLNEYERTLLTAAEAEKYAAIAAYVAEHPDYADPGTAVTVKFPFTAGDYTPSKDTNLYASAPDDNYVYRLFADGTKTYTGYKYALWGEVPTVDMTAYRGNEIRVRRLVVQSEAQYWMAFSVDGGETWVLPTETKDAAVATDRFFIFSYVIPKDYEGGELTILAKAISRSEYEAMSEAAGFETAIATLADELAACNAKATESEQAAVQAAYDAAVAAVNGAANADKASYEMYKGIAAMRRAVAAIRDDRTVVAGTTPNQYGYDETDAESVTVYVTYSKDGQPIVTDNGTTLNSVAVTVPYFDLANYDLDEYARYHTATAGVEGGSYIDNVIVERPTALHLFIYMLERYKLGLDEADCGKGTSDWADYMSFSGGPTSLYMENYWGEGFNLMYYRNHVYPMMSEGWGSTADYILLSDGDSIDLCIFSDMKFYSDPNAAFCAFEENAYTVEVGETLTVNTLGLPTSMGEGGDVAFYVTGLSFAVYSADGELVEEVSAGATGHDYAVTFAAPGTYYIVAADVESGCRAPASAVVTVTGEAEPKELAIISQPESVICAMGDTVTFTVEAEGDGLTYTWYYKNPGRTKFTAMAAGEKNTYTITMNADRNGRQMYCVVRDEYGNMLKTEVVTMALPTLTITQQPANVVCGLNSTATFTVAAEGEGELTYQWYYKNPTATKFTAMAIGAKNSYAITMEAKRNGRQMYCVVRDTYGNAVKSDVVTMTMPELVIVSQPESVTCADGEKATFTVLAEGDGLTYTWYYKNPRSSKFTAMSASEKNTYTITMNSARDGRQMYCVVKDANGQKLTTDTVTMTTAR